MKDITELQKNYEQRLRRKSLTSTILYYTFQLLAAGTAIASLVTYLVQRTGLETTAMQIFMCLLAILFMNIPVFFQKKFKWYIPGYITIILYIFIFAHFVLGEVFRVYDYSAAFDKLLHTTSGVIMSFIGFSFIYMINRVNPDKLKLSPFFIVLFTFCFTMTTEYMWELIEYFIDRMFGMNMQRWQDGIVETLANGNVVSSIPQGSGLKDSMMDMFVNIFGCLGVCVYIYVGMKLRPDWFEDKFILTNRQIKQMAAAAAEREYEKHAEEQLVETIIGEEADDDTSVANEITDQSAQNDKLCEVASTADQENDEKS